MFSCLYTCITGLQLTGLTKSKQDLFINCRNYENSYFGGATLHGYAYIAPGDGVMANSAYDVGDVNRFVYL